MSLYRKIINSWTSLCHPSIQTGWTGWRTSVWLWKWGDRRCGEQYCWLIGLWGRKVYVPYQQTQFNVLYSLASGATVLFVQSVIQSIRSFPLYSNVPHCISSCSATFPSALTHFSLFWCLIAMPVIGEYNKQKLSKFHFQISLHPRHNQDARVCRNRWNDVATSSGYATLFFNDFSWWLPAFEK